MMDFTVQRQFFLSGITRDPKQRVCWLDALQTAIKAQESALCAALTADLGKSPFEGYMTEIGMVLDELACQKRHLCAWSRPRRVRTPLAQFHAVSRVYPEPYGLALVMAPWNYPFQLSMEPLIGAIAAGNCVVLKPSNYAPHTAKAMADLLQGCLPEGLVRVVQGGRAENTELLDTRFDCIFFTGGKTVGRLVMQSAAKNLTPVSLELGGKSPVLVLRDANLELAARRILFGKLLNAGQTCVAPDYVLCARGLKQPLADELHRALAQFGMENALENPDYPRIVNEKHLTRLKGLLENADILWGGRSDGLRIEPTVISVTGRDAPAMQEEIFGPILPILEMDTLDEMVEFIRQGEKPLALYLFTNDSAAQKRVLSEVSFGGGCINDTIIHLATTHMGFGGVGESGMGAYHGKKSFDTFSHEKSVVKKSNWIDLPIRYHPYSTKKEKLVRFFLH